MIHHYANDDVETVVEHGVCGHHKEHPGSNFAGCTCWSHYTTRRRDKNSTKLVLNKPVDRTRQLRNAGDDLADLLTGIAASSRLTRTEEVTIDKYLAKWQEARRG